MKYIKKFLFWASGLIAALVLAIIALQVYYRLTPVELSAEAKALLEETKHMAQLTENGYRMHGILAPDGIDPAAYGKCYVDAWKKSIEAHQSSVALTGELSLEASSKAYEKRISETLQLCSQGKPRLSDLKTPAESDRIRPGFTWERLLAGAGNTPAPIYFDRWNAVLLGGRRGNDPDPINAVFPMYTASLQIERARLIRFASAWNASETDSQRAEAFNEIEIYLPKVVDFADGTLIESMISAAATSQHLLVIQAAVSRSQSIDTSLAQRMQVSAKSVDRLPRALANAIGAEVQGFNAINRRIAKDGMGSELNAFANSLGRFAFDPNETLNLSVTGYRESQKQVQDVALLDVSESKLRTFAENLGCPWLGELSLLCTAFERNATGRILATIAMPAFTEYGKRVHDVRNLAAATRLTIEARSRDLHGEALAKFVANTPTDMRDVVTGEAFAFDPTKKLLTVKLQTRSTVLGDKSYALPL